MIKPKDPMTILSAAGVVFFSALVVFARSMPSIWYLFSAGAALVAIGLAAYQYLASQELKTLPVRQQLHVVLAWISVQADSMSVLALTLAGVGFTSYVFLFVGVDSPRGYRLFLVAVAVDLATCAALAIQPYVRPQLLATWQVVLVHRVVFQFIWLVMCLGLLNVLVLNFWDVKPLTDSSCMLTFFVCGLAALLQAARIIAIRSTRTSAAPAQEQVAA